MPDFPQTSAEQTVIQTVIDAPEQDEAAGPAAHLSDADAQMLGTPDVSRQLNVRGDVPGRSNPREKGAWEFVMQLECWQCGALYVGGSGRSSFFYRHPVPSSRMNPEQAARTRDAGCQAWQLPAAVVESTVLDLLISFRANPRFAETYLRANLDHSARFHAMIERVSELRQTSRKVAEKRDKRLDDYRATRGSVAALQRVTEAIRSLYDVESTIDAARTQLLELHEEAAWLLELANDPAVIARDWDRGSGQREHILKIWIDRIIVEVQGDRRGAPRRLLVYLHLDTERPLIADIS